MRIKIYLSFIMLVLTLGGLKVHGTLIPMTDRNVAVGLSPYNWVWENEGISSTVSGASLTVKFKGTRKVALLVSTDHLVFSAPQRYPIIAWTVNGGKVILHQLVAGESMILLSEGVPDPLIDLYIHGMSPFENRYQGDLPVNSVKLNSFFIDDGGSTVRAKLSKRIWLTIGDSILAGDGAALNEDDGRPDDNRWASSDDPRASYGYLLAGHFGYRESRLAWGGYDWGGGMAGLPALENLIDSATSTISRLYRGKLMPVPDVVMINLGENGAPAAKDVVDALTKLRSRVKKGTRIIVMVPVSGRAGSPVTQAFQVYKKSSDDTHAYLVDLGRIAFATCDGQHPTAIAHQTIFRAAIAHFEPICTTK